MQSHLKIVIFVSVITLVNSMPQLDKQLTTRRPVIRPTTTTLRPALVTVQTTFEALSSIIASAGNFASTTIDSIRNTAYNVAQSAATNTAQFFDSATQAVNDGINSVASTINFNIMPGQQSQPIIAPVEVPDTRENEISFEN